MPVAGTDHNLDSDHATPRPNALAALYEKYFAVVPANSSELLEEVHRLRYQVYCIENQFEAPEQNPHGLEIDEYDGRSVHSLLFHRPSQRFIGTVRLILPNGANPERSFPFQRISDYPMFSAKSSAEISRFCISKALRQMPAAGTTGEDGAHQQRRLIPYVTLGLIKSLVQISVEHRITHWCIVVEPPLLRLLAGLGLVFQPVGPMVDYHGRRQPCYSHLHLLLKGVRQRRPDVWEVITNKGRLWPAEHMTAHHSGFRPEFGWTAV